MTALDNPSLSNSSNSNKGGQRNSRLSLRGQKRTLCSDISPAPEPRTSHRIRTNSSGDGGSDSGKGCSSRSKQNSALPNSAATYRAAQLGLRRHNPSSNSNSASSLSSNSSTNDSGTNSGSNTTTGVAGGRVPGVCPLANLGNTCFLNSVLYALRFLPGFTHDLHHLHTHLQTANCEGDEGVQHRVRFLTELHEVFVQLGREERSLSDAKRLPPLQPYPFLQALRVVNPMFEGNRQQDAHELLHCLLDQLCHLPQDLSKRGAASATGGGGGGVGGNSSTPSYSADSSPPHKRARRRSERIQAQEEDHSKALDVVGSKFVGRMCLETCCSECEKVTGREETFLEVCVPVKTKADFDDEEAPSDCEVFMSALCEEECLQGNNKYWCDACSHHNEARRSVHYPQLPHHLLIHVKRFSAYSRNMFTSKCSDAMPAPLQLSCFCRNCIGVKLLHPQNINNSNNDTNSPAPANNKLKNNNKKSQDKSESNVTPSQHLPYHLTAMVCHLGASLSSGHYMTYVRVGGSLLSSSCPDQLAAATQSSGSAAGGGVGAATSSGSAGSSATEGHSSHSSGGTIGSAGGADECEWLKCCALRLDHLLPSQNTAVNGCAGDLDVKPTKQKSSNASNNSDTSKGGRNSNKPNGGKGSQASHHNSKGANQLKQNGPAANGCLWLECDDEKIKLVSATEVTEKMRGTLITPYLLFYSRLPTTNNS